MQIEKIKISELKANPINPRKSDLTQEENLRKSLEKFGVVEPIIYNKRSGQIVGGHFRVRELKKLGVKEVDCVIVDLNEQDENELNIRLNANTGDWDLEILQSDWNSEDLEDWGLDVDFGVEEIAQDKNKGSLSDRFIIPPFSILDTKQGRWQDRKRWWLSLGIKSEIGRDAECLPNSLTSDKYKDVANLSSTSIFDPVLCELSYKWFNVPNGSILDPFAGGSVRGIVASYLGYNYTGNDLSKKQIEANYINAKEVLIGNIPKWTIGDSKQIDKLANGSYDMIFTCPPYADLEVYSKDKEDISNMNYEDFKKAYNEIIKKSCAMLKNDRFAVCVVGDVRDKNGFYKNFVSDTIMAFWNNGVILYNEMILVNTVGTLAIRSGRQFSKGRKVGKQHQNVLVFYKGNPKKIRDNYKDLDLSYLDEMEEDI